MIRSSDKRERGANAAWIQRWVSRWYRVEATDTSESSFPFCTSGPFAGTSGVHVYTPAVRMGPKRIYDGSGSYA